MHIFGDGYNKYESQLLALPILSSLWGLVSKTKNMIQSMRDIRSQHHINAWIVDLCVALSELKDPMFWSPINLLRFLARFYSMILRFKDYYSNDFTLFKSQSIEFNDISSIDVLLATIAMFGVPVTVMDGLKKLSLFTNKKILDTPSMFMELFIQFFHILKDSVDWIKTYLPESLHAYLNYFCIPLDFGITYKSIRKLEEIIFTYNKNPQVMFKEEFRIKVLNLDKELSSNLQFLQIITSPNYRHTSTMYKSFKDNILKLAKTYDTSSRIEPLCIVLEGPPGSGKSTFMNLFVNYLVKKNYSVYNHTCAAVETGKDFYDDYLNQDVFVMDDVGQQGVSQWRQIINFVSPVKYPLECAVAEMKNTKYFNSKIILVTTNRFSNLSGFTKSDCIAEPQALFRRCHVINFDNCKNGEGNMVYKKFDYVTNSWYEDMFLKTHNMSENVPAHMSISNKAKSIGWMYHIMNHMYNYNESQGVRSIIDDTLFNAIEHESNNFTYQDTFAEQSLDSDYFKGFGIFKEVITEFISTMYNNVLELLNIYSVEIGQNIAYGALGALGVLGVIVLIMKITGSNKNEEEIIQDFIVDWRLKMKGEGMYEQDINLDNKVETLQKRMRFVELIDKKGRRQLFQSLPSGRRLLIVNHGHTTNEGILNVFKTWDDAKNKKYELNNIPFTVVYEDPDKDISILELPLVIPLYKDSSDILFPENKIERNKNLYFINCDGNVSLVGNNKVNDRNFTIENYKRNIDVKSGEVILYPISASGLCGSLLYDITNGLVGMHIAGNTQHGVACKFSCQDLKIIKSYLRANTSIELRSISAEEDFSGARIHNDVFQVKPPLLKTSLKPTELAVPLRELAEEVGLKAPPNFKVFGKDTILKMGVKSLKPIPYIPEDEIEFAKKCIDHFLIDFNDVSDLEVIKGGHGLAPLNPDSVNGLGYDKDKSEYIDFERGVFKEPLKIRLESFISDCTFDTVKLKDLMFYEALKDELKPIEKINKPRTFRVAPLHHTVLCKRTMGRLLVHIKNNMWENQIAIGMNPYVDFHKLYMKLKRNDNVFDGDIGNWDGGTNAIIQDAVKDLIINRYKGKYPDTLRVLLNSMIRTFVNIRNESYLTTHSMPSGCWVTALFNSLYNRFITACCFYRNLKKNKRIDEATVENFLTLTDFVMGDDKICGVSNKFKDIYNALTVKEYFESLSMRFTDGEKGEITAPFKGLHELVFLKRKFRYHRKLDKIVGALSLETIINSLRYYDINKDYDVVLDGKLTAFQFEIFLHENEDIKDFVLTEAKQILYFREFTDDRIAESMVKEETYAQIQRYQNKFYDY